MSNSDFDITAEDTDFPDTDEFDTDDLANEYDHMLKLLDVAAQQACYKLIGDGRVTDAKKEQARSKWANTLITSVQTRRQVLESREIERMSREIEELREQRTERGWQ